MSKILCVLDGFGLAKASKNNAVSLAKMPNFCYLLKNYYFTSLDADGQFVGQEAGLVGNSEVGHMNLGGLKLVPQLSFQITHASQKTYDLDPKLSPDQNFDPKEFLAKNWEQKPKTIHLIGLFSSGTIHSDLRHWAGSIEAAGQAGAQKIVLHLLSDGRDSDRQSLLATWEFFIKQYAQQLKPFEDKIFLGSVGGRFYGMDRDNNWDRVAIGLLAMLDSKDKYLYNRFYNYSKLNYGGMFDDEKTMKTIRTQSGNPKNTYGFSTIESKLKEATYQYELGTFDEHIVPSSQSFVTDYPQTGSVEESFGINNQDTIWLINFRTDRMKQFVKTLLEVNQEFELNLTILGMNNYGDGGALEIKNLETNNSSQKSGYYPVFTSKPVQNTLAENIAKLGKTQLHLAETEKYNHVTYFFNGGQNKKSIGEDWMVIPSNKVASHAEKPEMKAKEITDYLLENLDKYDYVIMNYANPDMVGHTGDLQAGITSLEALDEQLGRLIPVVEAGNHTLIITADHGNIEVIGEYEKNDKALIDTEHNPNPVPLIIVNKNLQLPILSDNLTKILNELNSDILASDLQTQLETISSDKNAERIDQWILPESVYKPTLPLHLAGIILLSI